MAICRTCQQVYTGTSCTERRAFAWGAEPDWAELREAPDDPSWPCHDCGTPPGGRHHHGCAVARCALGCRNPADPVQAAQALFCEHHTDCEPPDDGDGGDELPVIPVRPLPVPQAPLFS